MPVIAHLLEYRHEHIPEKVERTEHGRQASDFPVDARRVVTAQRGVERGGIQRRPSHRIGRDRGGRASGRGEVAQFPVAKSCEAADAVPVFHGTAQQPQPRDVGVRVHAAAVVTDGRDGAMTALPSAQRIDANPGQLGDDADRVARGRLAFLAHRAAILTTTAHAADATMPHATSTSTRTNGHWRSVE